MKTVKLVIGEQISESRTIEFPCNMDGLCTHRELYDPETGNVWVESTSGELFFTCTDVNWDISGLNTEMFQVPDEFGTNTEKELYVYFVDVSDCIDEDWLMGKSIDNHWS